MFGSLVLTSVASCCFGDSDELSTSKVTFIRPFKNRKQEKDKKVKKFHYIVLGLLTCIIAGGCQTPEPISQTVWKLPPNLGKTKSDIGIQMYGPMTSSGGQLDPGLAQQFIECVQSKMIQSKRFHVYLPNQFGEMPSSGDTDVIVKPFVDVIEQALNNNSVAHICKVMLDVKIMDKDGEAKEAINLDGVSKVVSKGVMGNAPRDVDKKGLVIKAFDEAYRLLERQLLANFPPAANVVQSRTIQIPPPPGWKQGDPMPQPMLKVTTRGGANIGFKAGWKYMLFAMVDGSPVMIAILDTDSIMDEKAAFKSIEINMSDPESFDLWTRIVQGKEKFNLLVTPYLN